MLSFQGETQLLREGVPETNSLSVMQGQTGEAGKTLRPIGMMRGMLEPPGQGGCMVFVQGGAGSGWVETCQGPGIHMDSVMLESPSRV